MLEMIGSERSWHLSLSANSMQRAARLTLKEFAPAFYNSKPPTGWGKKIAVAYSGGVDSTCLLYLINSLIKKSSPLKDLSLVAIHIDHKYRETSYLDVEHCQKWTKEQSIPFISYQIPWTQPPFSSLTVTARNTEEMGRIARYRAIFDAMKEENADVLFMAHHMDDQIETALMRQARQKEEGKETTLIGMAGMRACRRWGMGNYPRTEMRYMGHEGMNHWICRPLLDFSKDLLIAMAKEEKLAFVEDKSNQDTKLTERNAIRAKIAQMGTTLLLPVPTNPFKTTSILPSKQDAPAPDVIREYAELRHDVDHAVDEYLKANKGFSPAGAYHLITSRGLPPPRIVQFGIIMRILRYVSPSPWGSPYAEAGRSTEKLTRIANILWPYSGEEGMREYSSRGRFNSRTKFCGGSDVLWNPTPMSGIPTPNNDSWKLNERTFGWIAQRQRPHRLHPAILDITAKLRARDSFSIFWDSRWLCDFSENAIDVICSANFLPRSVIMDQASRFVIAPRDLWYAPAIHYSDGSNPRNPHLTPLAIPHTDNPSVRKTFSRTIDAI